MPVSVELSKALDETYENSSLAEILDAPVAALAGVAHSDAEHLAAALNSKTVSDPSNNKYFSVAGVLVALAGHSGGSRQRADHTGREEPRSRTHRPDSATGTHVGSRERE